MAGFDDLIPNAMPYLATEELVGTAGTSWQWDYPLVDNLGNPVDLTTGFAGTAVICAAGSTTSVVTVSLTFATGGVVRCTVTPSASAAVPPGAYFHEVTITRTSDSRKIIVVGAGDSKFIVKRKVSA